ncbi:hypothetical protein [Mitsuaria sp. BK037]|uniref:hypothetical protein n=1 Tax=Mitsuaria sp. BK037 TaxID=2587122 RepID=UPI00160DC7CD|nr:hypothetical protein [Mitsuaria sp. BK037]MBB3281643.1 hypothetical protein [Mitsuaria sp. BK037]
MTTIDRIPGRDAARWGAKVALALMLAACGAPAPQAPSRPPAQPPAAAPEAAVTPAAPAAPVARRGLPLPAPRAVSSHEALRRQAAERMVAANPDGTYMGEVPPQLLAIPVLEVELNQDGSIRHIRVLRKPSQAEDTIEVAIAAVRRAAPFGDVSRLPKPWKFVEVFLFDDDRRFKPRTLDD